MRTSFRTLPFILILLGTACGEGHTPVAAPPPGTPVDSFILRIKEVERRMTASPLDAALYVERAKLYRDVDSLGAAIKDMERAVALDSTNASDHTLLGELFYTSVQVDKATVQFEHAIRLDPMSTEPLLKLAEIKLVLRDHASSIDLVNKALRLDPNLAQGYYLKGWVYMEKGDTATAISSFRTAVEQDPADYRSFMQLGLLSSAQRDPLALQYFNTALELRPYSVEALYGKAMCAQEAGMDSLALSCYARILELDSTNSLAHYNSGFVRMEYLRDLEQAKKDFSEAIRLEPNYYQAWYNRGVAMERTAQLDSAAANYQVALTIEPGFTEAALALQRLSAQGVRIKMKPPTSRSR